jgi:hypothetical protein
VSADPETRRKRSLRGRTRLLGAVSTSAAAVLIGAEGARVWRLGRLPLTHGDLSTGKAGGPREAVAAIREGYRVSSTRENAVVNMLASFILTFGLTRGTTHAIRSRGRLGPIRDVFARGRHIHHFVPGGIVSLITGGLAISLRSPEANRWLAIPFGAGAALVLDETALLLELEDVYWSEEGVLGVQTAFATAGLLAAIAYAIQVRREGQPGTERDWRTAARAWEQLERLPGAGHRLGG